MRIALTALLLIAPITAFGQSAAHIARQVWPLGPPVSSSVAPSQAPSDAGSFGSSNLARQIWPYGAPTSTDSRPPQATDYAGGFTVLDLARLRDAPGLEQHEATQPFLLARTVVPND